MKKKKLIKIGIIALAALSIIGVTLSQTVFRSGEDSALAQASQEVTVTRGNLSVEISAAGNLALADTQDLAFQVAGTVYEVLVEESDTVTAGQELAKLDTTEWDQQLKTLEKAVVTAQRNVTARENDVTKAERQVASLERQVISKESDVTKAERNVTEKELAVREAELAVTKAEDSLGQIEEVKKAQDNVDTAEMDLTAIQMIISGAISGGGNVADATYWRQREQQAEEDLAAAKEDLNDILENSGLSLSSDVALQLAEVQLQVEKAKMALEDAQTAVEDAKSAVTDAQLAVDDANFAVEEAKNDVVTANYTIEDANSTLSDAQDALAETQSLSPIITAPFDGFIPQISVKGGDEVLKGTVAMQIADPNKFEAEITVSEMDISQVELGGPAWVEVDAADGVILPAVITYIAPTATIQSGVVSYKVTVEVQSTTSDNATSASGDNATMTSPAGTGTVPGAMTASASDYQLREGLTVTVSLVVADAQDVLLVPYTAITTNRGQSYVQVVNADGTTEARVITTGVTDYSYTEVTSGLEEGEKVLVSNASTSTSTSSTQQSSQGGMMIPGVMDSGGPPSGGPPGGG
jgi:RND family efflux transporter MFP subunit